MDKTRTLAMLLAFVFSMTAYQTVAETRSQLHFFDKVVEVTDAGYLVFENEGGYRLWGVDPDTEYLRSLVVNKTLSCKVVGRTFEFRSRVNIVNCSEHRTVQQGGGTAASKHITELLIRSGHGREFCTETGNYYGTCEW